MKGSGSPADAHADAERTRAPFRSPPRGGGGPPGGNPARFLYRPSFLYSSPEPRGPDARRPPRRQALKPRAKECGGGGATMMPMPMQKEPGPPSDLLLWEVAPPGSCTDLASHTAHQRASWPRRKAAEIAGGACSKGQAGCSCCCCYLWWWWFPLVLLGGPPETDPSLLPGGSPLVPPFPLGTYSSPESLLAQRRKAGAKTAGPEAQGEGGRGQWLDCAEVPHLLEPGLHPLQGGGRGGGQPRQVLAQT